MPHNTKRPLANVCREILVRIKGAVVPLILCLIGITILSLLPQRVFPKPHFSFEDLLVHIAMYTGLSLCVAIYLWGKQKKQSKSHITVFLSIVSYGIIMELLQKYLPINRFFSLEDIIANSIGASSFFYFRNKMKE